MLRGADFASQLAAMVDNQTNYTHLALMSDNPKKRSSRTTRAGLVGEFARTGGDGEPLIGQAFGYVLTSESAHHSAKTVRPVASSQSYRLTQESAKRLRAIERGRKMIEQDLQAAGGTLSTKEVAAHLEITAQAVDKQRIGGRLLAVVDPQGHFRFPAFQFTRPRVRQHLQEVLRRLDERSPFVKLNWLLNPDARLGAAPVDLLDRGEVEPVLRAADTFGHHVPG